MCCDAAVEAVEVQSDAASKLDTVEKASTALLLAVEAPPVAIAYDAGVSPPPPLPPAALSALDAAISSDMGAGDSWLPGSPLFNLWFALLIALPFTAAAWYLGRRIGLYATSFHSALLLVLSAVEGYTDLVCATAQGACFARPWYLSASW